MLAIPSIPVLIEKEIYRGVRRITYQGNAVAGFLVTFDQRPVRLEGLVRDKVIGAQILAADGRVLHRTVVDLAVVNCG